MAEAELPKTTSFSKEDRLSSLSDDLICHILSFLPTKFAYKTSVLSTRWTSLCTKVPDLHFKLPYSTSWREPSTSIHSVSVGLLRRTEKIRKLSLHSNRCEPYAMHHWVTKALDLGVKELDLDLVFNRTIFLPRRLSTLESLVVLNLQGHIQPSLTSVTYLPSLKILNLEVTYWETKNQDYLSAFLSGCPCLEELQIQGRLQFPLEISLHFLKRLCLHLDLDISSQRQPLRILNVPSIETLDIHDYSHHKYEVVNLFNVDRATLNISKPLIFDSLYKLMEGLLNVKSLYLEFCTVQVLQFLEMDNLDNLSHLQFHNLLCLRVQISQNCNLDVLVALLQNTPNLEVLIIEKHFETNSNRSKVRNSSWTKPTIIPTCLLTNFKVLEFRGIENLKFELDFMEYIVENSAKLEKVEVSAPKSRKLKLERKNKASAFTWV